MSMLTHRKARVGSRIPSSLILYLIAVRQTLSLNQKLLVSIRLARLLPQVLEIQTQVLVFTELVHLPREPSP